MAEGGFPFIARVMEHWTTHSVPYLSGVSESELHSFELRHRVRLPCDVRAFLERTNGLSVPGTSQVDHNQYEFWPLDEWRPVEDEPDVWYFGEHAQSSWMLAVNLGPATDRGGSTVYVVTDKIIPIAPSFATFMDLYVQDDAAIYPVTWDDGRTE